MPPYPTGKTEGIASLMQPGASEFTWQVNNFERPEQGKLVIYEMLMRDFLVQDYAGLVNRLDYFEELGVNAIEPMPVNEFDGNISWGYNPTYHYALDKAYGTPEAFKTLVDESQSAGHKAVSWNGTDRRGQRVATGVYFYCMVAGEFKQTRKMVLIK